MKGRDDVEVTIEVHGRPCAEPFASPDDVQSGMAGGVLGPPLGGEIFDVEPVAQDERGEPPREAV